MHIILLVGSIRADIWSPVRRLDVTSIKISRYNPFEETLFVIDPILFTMSFFVSKVKLLVTYMKKMGVQDRCLKKRRKE